MTSRNPTTSARGFTLVEILVSISIIIILAAMMIAVAGFVQKNARINETRTTLKAIEGIIEKYEADTNTKLVGTTGAPSVVGTTYTDDSVPATDKGKVILTSPAYGDITYNYVDILSRHPATREMIAKLGNKVKTSTNASGTITYIVDSWGTPIHFIPQGWVPGNLPASSKPIFAQSATNPYTPASRTYLRSSGPDRSSDFTDTSKSTNNDDIYSYEP